MSAQSDRPLAPSAEQEDLSSGMRARPPILEPDRETVCLAEPHGEQHSDPPPEAVPSIETISEVLVGIARGDFAVQSPRSYRGDALDVLSYLVNATAEEVGVLVRALREERRELERVQETLVTQGKLAALGELAGGVAHELNQPLTVMQALCELLLERPGRTIESCRDEIELIAAAAGRMGRIVSAVRTFGRRTGLSLAPIAPRAPVDSALLLLAEQLRVASIRVEVEEYAPPMILGDADALQQVFINLLINARDALLEVQPPLRRRVNIVIEAGPVDERGEPSVRYVVSDTGPGIPREVVPRIFDPFFSTKPVGHGTGLGLSITHGIVADHGGHIRYVPRADDTPGCFEIVLPASPRRPSGRPPA